MRSDSESLLFSLSSSFILKRALVRWIRRCWYGFSMVMVASISIRCYWTKLTTSSYLSTRFSTYKSLYMYLLRLAKHLQKNAPIKLLLVEDLFFSFVAESNWILMAKEAMGAMKKPPMIFRPSKRPPTSPSQSKKL